MAQARRGGRGASVTAVAALRELVARLEKDWPEGLTVLTGDDAWHLDRAVGRLLDTLIPQTAGDYALTVFGDERVPISDVVDAVRSRGMFADRRVVLVRDAAILDGDPAPLQAYAESPSPDSFLIVRAPALDQRRRTGKVLAGAGCLVRFARGVPGEERDLARTIRDLSRERGLSIGPDVVAFLSEASAGDLYVVSSELDKLRAWVGRDGGRVTLDDATRLVASGGAMSGWEVSEAILDRDLTSAVASARRLLDAGDEPLRLLGGVAWRVRGMVQARALLDSGMPPRDVTRAVRAGWNAQRFLEGVRRYRMDELLEFPYHIAEADRALKSSSIEPGAVFERLVARLVGGAAIEPERRPATGRP